VTVSAVPDDQSAEVGGLQNTVTNFGASLGTALVGAVLISSLTTGLASGIEASGSIPPDLKAKASTELAGGVPFVSDTDLKAALAKADVPAPVADEVVKANSTARVAALRSSLWVVALFGTGALFLTGLVPTVPIGRRAEDQDAPPEVATA
jgi:hypothetical protein